MLQETAPEEGALQTVRRTRVLVSNAPGSVNSVLPFFMGARPLTRSCFLRCDLFGLVSIEQGVSYHDPIITRDAMQPRPLPQQAGDRNFRTAEPIIICEI